MPIPKMKSFLPLGSQVMIEIIPAAETYSNVLHIEGELKNDTPQGYVMALGPAVPDSYGIKKGDRVFFSTSSAVYPPGKRSGKENRQLACIDHHTIRGIVVEE